MLGIHIGYSAMTTRFVRREGTGEEMGRDGKREGVCVWMSSLWELG
jgi:hypothetical protein